MSDIIVELSVLNGPSRENIRDIWGIPDSDLRLGFEILLQREDVIKVEDVFNWDFPWKFSRGTDFVATLHGGDWKSADRVQGMFRGNMCPYAGPEQKWVKYEVDYNTDVRSGRVVLFKK